MPSLKSDLALAVNLLGRDPQLCTLMALVTKEDKSSRIVPMKQQPGEASAKPLLSVYPRYKSSLGGNISTYNLVVDIYVPLLVHKETGVGYDILRRVIEVLHHQPIGRGLHHPTSDPDRPSTTGWHKSQVNLEFQSTQY